MLLDIRVGPGEGKLKSSLKAPIVLCVPRVGCKNTLSLPILSQCEAVHISSYEEEKPATNSS